MNSVPCLSASFRKIPPRLRRRPIRLRASPFRQARMVGHRSATKHQKLSAVGSSSPASFRRVNLTHGVPRELTLPMGSDTRVPERYSCLVLISYLARVDLRHRIYGLPRRVLNRGFAARLIG